MKKISFEDIEPTNQDSEMTEIIGAVATGTYAEIVGTEAAERFFAARQSNGEESYNYAIKRFGPKVSAAHRFSRDMLGR